MKFFSRQSLDEAQDERAVRISYGGAHSHRQVQATSTSRQSAAIVGIALALGLGFFALNGSNLIGQVAQTEIRITDDGFEPERITLTPGTEIIWQNSSGIPHILASDTLPLVEGSPFESATIFPGDSLTVTLDADAGDQEYSYISRTSPDTNGFIVVSQNAPPPANPTPSTPPVPVDTLPPLDDVTVTPPDLTDTDPFSVPTPTPINTAGNDLLPINPHTVDNPNSVPQPRTELPPIARTQTRPTAQPTTGPNGIWVLGIVAILGIVALCRKQLGL